MSSRVDVFISIHERVLFLYNLGIDCFRDYAKTGNADMFIEMVARYEIAELEKLIPIPVKNLSKICEDFTARQGSADAVCL